MTLISHAETETLSEHRYRSVSHSVAACPDPALALIIKMRGQHYGYEDICVALQREGFLVSKTAVRRFILGPKRDGLPRGQSREAVRGGQR